MNIDRQVQQRLMFPPSEKPGDGKISGIAPGCSSGVPPVAGSENIVSALASVYRRWPVASSGPVPVPRRP